jgi:hypothetical protein
MRIAQTTEKAAANLGPLFLFSEIETMTLEEYHRAARRLGLKPTNVPNVWANSTGEFYSVPDATNYTLDQRAETIEMLKRNLGISSAP